MKQRLCLQRHERYNEKEAIQKVLSLNVFLTSTELFVEIDQPQHICRKKFKKIIAPTPQGYYNNNKDGGTGGTWNKKIWVQCISQYIELPLPS